MKLIKIEDAGLDHRYDQLVGYPDDMPIPVAVALVDEAILKVKDTNPDEYEWGNLMAELKPHGFFDVEWAEATEGW